MNKTWKYIYEYVKMASTLQVRKNILYYISHYLPFVS